MCETGNGEIRRQCVRQAVIVSALWRNYDFLSAAINMCAYSYPITYFIDWDTPP